MFPSLSQYDQANIGDSDAKPLSKGGVANAFRGQFADLLHLLSGQLGWLVAFVSTTSAAAFAVHITDVVAMGSGKEVVRIHTGAIVPFRAIVASLLTFWDWPMMQFVAKAMGIDDLAANIEDTVAVTRRACPFPTGGEWANANMLPESLFWRQIRSFGVVSLKKASRWFSDGLTATAFAKFGRGRANDRILHSNVSLLDLLTPPDASNVAVATLLVATRVF